jgi:hypothetical protein
VGILVAGILPSFAGIRVAGILPSFAGIRVAGILPSFAGIRVAENHPFVDILVDPEILQKIAFFPFFRLLTVSMLVYVSLLG